MERYINYQVSTKGSDHKLSGEEVKRLSFIQKETSVEDLVDFIQKGYAITQMFKKEQGKVNRKKKNWMSSDFVVLDIDNGPCPYQEFVSSLTYPPTICYTTSSYNEEEGKYKYRMIYVMKDTIRSEELYHQLYDGICWSMENRLNFVNEDNCCRTVNQLFFGNGIKNTSMVYDSSRVYQISDFKEVWGKVPCKVMEIREPEEDTEQVSPLIKEQFDFDKEMKDDLLRFSFKKFLYKYFNMGFKPILDSPIPEDEYVNGIAEKEHSSVWWGKINLWNGRESKILGVGSGRQHKIQLYAMISRKMGLNANEIMFNLVYIVQNFMTNVQENGRETFQGEDIWRLVRWAMSVNPEDINLPDDKRQVRVSKKYAVENGMSTQKVLGLYKTNRTNKRIENNFDMTKTDEEVAELSGVGVQRVARCRTKELGITKKQILDNVISKYYDETLSLRKNSEHLKELGYKVTHTRIGQWLKESHRKKSD